MTMKACCVEEDSKIHTADEQRGAEHLKDEKKQKHKNFSHQTRKQKKNFNSIHTHSAREKERKK